MDNYIEFERQQTVRVYFTRLPDDEEIKAIKDGELFDGDEDLLDWIEEEIIGEDYSYFERKPTFKFILNGKNI